VSEEAAGILVHGCASAASYDDASALLLLQILLHAWE